jgi:glycosyltransferase involved in cell wall biosynthesis
VPVQSIDTVEEFVAKPDDVFIYHFSVGWDQGLYLSKTLPCRRVIKYHNVTPPEYYDSVNEDYAAVCRAGREMLREIAHTSADLFLSDSAYNMSELVERGAPASRNFVVPPFHQIDRLVEADADLATLERVRDGRTNILMVGRLAPNKGHVALVEAFASYHYNYNRLSRLIIVGKHDPRLKIYIDSVHAAIRRADLQDHVIFTEEVSDEQLKAYFLAAHVFAIATEHEGFCVPVVEAMAHHVPVAAYATTALTETVGPAGIIWEERDSELLAASIAEILRNPATFERLSEIGWERYRSHFHNDVIRRRFLDSMKDLLAPVA